MFNDLSADVLEVMHELEARDKRDRDDARHIWSVYDRSPRHGTLHRLWAASVPAGR